MKLQGVIILRISDFQRFFDLDEFLVKKNEFLELLARYGTRLFCNTLQERDLCGIVRNWLNGVPISAEISAGKLIVHGVNGRNCYPLGVLQEQIDKYSGKLGFKDLYGLTAVYLLAGVNKADCPFKPDYGIMVNEKTDTISDENFISLHKDISLPVSDSASEGVFCVRVFANINAGIPIKVSTGDEEVILKEGQCVTAIFSDSGCVTLLCREISPMPGVYATMVPDKANKCANLVINRDSDTQVVTDVTSVWEEGGSDLAYVTAAGKVGYDKVKCYNLDRRLSVFFRNANGRKLLAIKKKPSGNYLLYTDTRIEY